LPIVFVVDDDVSVRESLELLIENAGWRPETFVSAQEFLVRPRALTPSCLVLDVSMPGRTHDGAGHLVTLAARLQAGRPEAAARSGADYQGAGL
jgi:FixJ family two-component response regulator